MLSISTNGIGQMDLSATSKPKSKQKDEHVNDAFATLMNMGSVSKNDECNNVNRDDNFDNSSSFENIEDSMDVYNKNSGNDESFKVISKEQQINDEDDIKVTDSDFMDALSQLICDIKQILFDELGISEETFNDIVSQLDMTSLDLLDANFIKKFILNNENSTEVDILINEDLSDLIDNVNLDIENAIIKYDAVSLSELVQRDSDYREQILNLLEGFNTEQEVIDDVSFGVSEDVEFEILKDDLSFDSESVDDVMHSDKIFATISDVEADSKDFNNHDSRNNNFERVIFEMDKAINNLTLDGVDSLSEFEEVQRADIIRQVIDSVKVNLSKEVTSLEVQLNPENLGKVQITVASKNGVMQAQILAENELAKNAIENNIAMLRETFNNQELKVDAIEVMVSTYGFLDHEQQDGDEQAKDKGFNNSRSINLGEDINIDDLDEDEQLTVEMMKVNGNSLNYLV